MGFKSELWPCQNISFRDFFSNHFLVAFSVWPGALSCWKITSSLFSPGNNFWRLGSNPFSHIFWYSFEVIDCSHLISSPTPADENSPQTMILPPPCFAVVEMHSGLHLSPDLQRQRSGTSLQNSDLDSSLHRTLWNQSESQFAYSAKKCNLS